MSGNNVPAQDEEEPVAIEEKPLHLKTVRDHLSSSLTTPISVKEWLNNVEEEYEKVDGPPPPIPPRNPRRLQLRIRKEPTYDELEVSPGSDGSKMEQAKSWPKNNDSVPEESARGADDKGP